MKLWEHPAYLVSILHHNSSLSLSLSLSSVCSAHQTRYHFPSQHLSFLSAYYTAAFTEPKQWPAPVTCSEDSLRDCSSKARLILVTPTWYHIISNPGEEPLTLVTLAWYHIYWWPQWRTTYKSWFLKCIVSVRFPIGLTMFQNRMV